MDLRQYAATQAEAVPVPPAPPPPILAREQAREAQDAIREAEVYRRYQEAIRTSETARAAITKGLQAGLNPYRLLLIATECIGKLTGDTVFNSSAHDAITLLYGEIEGDPQALEIELEEVETRLENLRRYQAEHDTEMRVQSIIRQHEHRAQELKNRIG